MHEDEQNASEGGIATGGQSINPEDEPMLFRAFPLLKQADQVQYALSPDDQEEHETGRMAYARQQAISKFRTLMEKGIDSRDPEQRKKMEGLMLDEKMSKILQNRLELLIVTLHPWQNEAVDP